MNISLIHRLCGLMLLWTLLIPICQARNDGPTLGQIRAELLNKQVLLRKGSGKDVHSAKWYVAERLSDGSFRLDSGLGSKNVPIDDSNRNATIIAISIQGSPFDKPINTEKAGAFGDKFDENKVKDPYIQVVVAPHDGTYLGLTTYYVSMMGYAFEDPARAAKIRDQTERLLNKLKGTTLYVPAYGNLYDVTIPLDDLTDMNARLKYSDRSTPPATPLKVVDAKISSEIDAPVIKVALPDGSARLLLGSFDSFYENRGYKPTDLDLMGFSAETSLKKFKPAEVKAIREQRLFKGMSVDALYWAMGLPEKENDYGAGGKQLIFGTRMKSFVYVKGEIVTGWQFLE